MTTITIQNPAITSTTGVFSCSALSYPLIVGQPVTITGTFSAGSLTGYTSGATYYVISVPTTTAFQLSATLGGPAITSTVSNGVITGITIETLSKTATVYVKKPSKHCMLALRALHQAKYDITKLDISNPANKTQLLALLPNVKAVPQIWIDGVHIGGLKDLKTFLTTH